MRKIRGFKIRKRIIQISGWFIRKGWTQAGSFCKSKILCKFIGWGRRLKNRAKYMCSVKSGSGYIRIGQDPIDEKRTKVPKGHLAIYVGQKIGEFHRVLVPVIYFNHPLFGELLREAEQEYGFNHQGGITIPCEFSEFERVQTRIAAVTCGRKAVWKSHHL